MYNVVGSLSSMVEVNISMALFWQPFIEKIKLNAPSIVPANDWYITTKYLNIRFTLKIELKNNNLKLRKRKGN